MTAWSGGTYDTKRDRLIVWGGGHADYAGNEVYVFDINSLKWQRLTNPSGWPPSVHSYDQIEYLPDQDRFFAFGGSVWVSGGSWSGSAAFNFNNNQWEQKQSVPRNPGLAATCAWNPNAKKLSVLGARSYTFEYDPVNDSWKYFDGAHFSEEPAGNAVFMLNENVMYNIVGPWGSRPISYEQIFYRAANGSLVKKLLKTDGEKTWQGFEEGPGLAYAHGHLWGWANGSKVYRLENLDLTSQTGTWVEYDFGSTGPTIQANQTQGTYGRFQYMPNFNGFVVVQLIDENVWVVKLPASLSAVQKKGKAAAGLVSELSAFPNPLYPSTTISYSGREKGTLCIFDVKGKLVQQFSTENGSGKVIWNGKNINNVSLASGVYLAKYKSGNRVLYLRLIITR
jgi:hypothetical protein